VEYDGRLHQQSAMKVEYALIDDRNQVVVHFCKPSRDNIGCRYMGLPVLPDGCPLSSRTIP
jgi:hypothetical protein